jgi:hypothetical protein
LSLVLLSSRTLLTGQKLNEEGTPS